MSRRLHARTGTRSRTTEDGASAVEYGLLVAGIAALVVAAVFLFGNTVANLFGNSCGTISNTITSGTATHC